MPCAACAHSYSWNLQTYSFSGQGTRELERYHHESKVKQLLDSMTFFPSFPVAPGHTGDPQPRVCPKHWSGMGWCPGEGALLSQGGGGPGSLGEAPAWELYLLVGILWVGRLHVMVAHLTEELHEWPWDLSSLERPQPRCSRGGSHGREPGQATTGRILAPSA